MFVGTHEFRMRALFRHAPVFEYHHMVASAAFAMRCVTMITVLPRSASARMVCRIRVSLSTSTLLVASSKM